MLLTTTWRYRQEKQKDFHLKMRKRGYSIDLSKVHSAGPRPDTRPTNYKSRDDTHNSKLPRASAIYSRILGAKGVGGSGIQRPTLRNRSSRVRKH